MVRAYFSFGVSWKQVLLAIVLSLSITFCLYKCSAHAAGKKCHKCPPLGSSAYERGYLIFSDYSMRLKDEGNDSFVTYPDEPPLEKVEYLVTSGKPVSSWYAIMREDDGYCFCIESMGP